MKRLLIAILTSTFLLPVCGSVLAFAATEVSHHNGAHHSVQDTPSMEKHESDMSTMENNAIMVVDSLCEENITNPSGLGCCDSSHANSKIGIWHKGEVYKYINNIGVTLFFVSQDSIYEESKSIRIHPSTAPPPDKQNYASLVGIIKRLD